MAARDEIIGRVVDAIWTELERQSAAGECGHTYVEREITHTVGIIDGGVDMPKVAAAALGIIEADTDDTTRQYMTDLGWR